MITNCQFHVNFWYKCSTGTEVTKKKIKQKKESNNLLSEFCCLLKQNRQINIKLLITRSVLSSMQKKRIKSC